jgi:hypothetical protein
VYQSFKILAIVKILKKGGWKMLVNVSQAARELGVCTEHIRRQIRAGNWPIYRLGPKAIRLDLEEIRKLGRVLSERKDEGK